MDVLLIGGGGREHALAWAIAKSPMLGKLFCAPGNAGIAAVAECVTVDVSDHASVENFCKMMSIGLVVVGPEAPLVAGLADDLRAAGIPVFGPSREAAQLEGSKAFTKSLCDRHNIPTARYRHFNDISDARAWVEQEGAPIVIKADGLAAGKGVTVATTVGEALTALDDCMAGGGEVVIEECLVGEEASFFVLSDGTSILPLATAQDHKRAFDGDEGPNTGGMGAYSPAPVMTPDLVNKAIQRIVEPTVKGMAAEGMPFAGVLYAGLILSDEGPKLIEYNIRFGDPECQVLMARLDSDLLEILLAVAKGELDGVTANWRDDTALTVVMAANGYPGSYEKGSKIEGVEAIDEDEAIVFHAGTARNGEDLVATGGRVLCVTGLGKDVTEAAAKAYAGVGKIHWPGGFNRTDIGWREIEREKSKR
ncbi:phosphoribosylamine--glycine ligase [Tepidamorphus sp. 3E244]|uniref:phosphoribosylamine--glycine ligase n=1 Tax=Tepidamorphus sp. 3E244 TaxID=3385498 RepID=UPI0038FD2275